MTAPDFKELAQVFFDERNLQGVHEQDVDDLATELRSVYFTALDHAQSAIRKIVLETP